MTRQPLLDLYDIEAALLDLQTPKPGWIGSHTTREAPGAWGNGARVRKVSTDEGGTAPGTLGRVLGSLYCPEGGYAYFIEWEDKPRVAVMAVAGKLELA